MGGIRILCLSGGSVIEEPAEWTGPLNEYGLGLLLLKNIAKRTNTVYGKKVVVLLDRDDVNALADDLAFGDAGIDTTRAPIPAGQTAILGEYAGGLVVECESLPSDVKDVDFLVASN